MDNMPRILSEQECTKLFETLAADLSWKWDSRFETPLSEISTLEKGSVANTLESYLGLAWDSETIGTAPEREQRILVRFGGIMPSQFFYTAGLPGDGIIFCLWWPWGNGQTISVRIGTIQDETDLLANLVPLTAR